MLAHFKMFDEYMSVSSFSYKYDWSLTEVDVLSCQPRVTVTSCFVYKVIGDLEAIYHLCINRINKQLI